MRSQLSQLLAAGLVLLAQGVVQAYDDAEYLKRVEIVTKTPGHVAFWDFVKREQSEKRR